MSTFGSAPAASLALHPHARQSLKKLSLPGPMMKYLAHISCAVDLSNSTNPYSPYLPDYPDIDPIDLKQLYLNTLENNHLKPKNLLFTVGSVDGMDLILRGFAEPYKDIVCVTDPTFPAYEHWATLYDLPVEKVPLKGENYEELMVGAIHRINPKIFILCDPNNPTGTQVSPGTVEKICSAISGLVVVDEAYIEFSGQPSATKILHNHGNLIVLRTLSKGWGMAGARCGMVLSDERIINTLLYIQAPFSLSQPSQEWVKKCLIDPSAIQASWQTLKKDRDYLACELGRLPCIRKVYPSQANFIMAILNDFEETFEWIEKAGIHVADNRRLVADSIKISISTPEDNEALLEALRGKQGI